MMRGFPHDRVAPYQERVDERGSAILMILAAVTVLGALAGAQALLLRSSLRNATFFLSHAQLRDYAESGVNLALHDLSHDTGVDAGKIGTTSWSSNNDDRGVDCQANTGDLGEGDGIPTAGEPSVVPVSVGPTQFGGQIFVWVGDTAWNGVRRIVSTAYTSDSSVTVEVYANSTAGGSALPETSMYVDPDVVIKQYNGDGANGTDTNPSGAPGPGAATWGIATSPGDPAGSNAALILSQIPSGEQGTVGGMNGSPSVGETPTLIDMDALFQHYQGIATVTYSGGSLSNAFCGTAADPKVTYFTGTKWALSGGDGIGAGVLVVDVEEFTMSGDSSFQGLVIVRAAKKLTLSGGPTPHVYGTLVVTPGSTIPEYTQSGGAEVVYSSQALQFAAGLAPAGSGGGGGGGGGAGSPYAVAYRLPRG